MTCKSSFHGNISEIPNISVDNFENLGRKAYFLSHCHTDHTQGLYSDAFLDYLKESNVYIYMSEPSAAIVRHEYCNDIIMEFIKPLKLGRTSIVVPGNTADEDIYLNIALIPAGHCFGSVMFLFNIKNKSILYTGDFRISVNDVSKMAHLHTHGEPVKIDAMYVDTTFLEKTHNMFPKRSDTVEYVIGEIKQWLDKNESNKVALHTRARYGYEFIFNEIYKKLNMKVYVTINKWMLYRNFHELLPGVTNNLEENKIHLCSNSSDITPHTKCLSQRDNSEYLYIYFSAYKWRDVDVEEMVTTGDKRIDICFATHCSRTELIYFVNYFSPKKIVGFPNEYVVINSREVTPKKRKLATVVNPEKKEELSNKVDTKLLKRMFDL